MFSSTIIDHFNENDRTSPRFAGDAKERALKLEHRD
jgi:hypothetical protein